MEPSDQRRHNSDDLATVASAYRPVEAELLRIRLEQAGIEVRLADEHLPAMHYGLGIAVGGVKVLVGTADADAAHSVLADSEAPLASDCPACGSGHVDREVRASRATTLVLWFLVAAPVPYPRHKGRCRACGHTWGS